MAHTTPDDQAGQPRILTTLHLLDRVQAVAVAYETGRVTPNARRAGQRVATAGKVSGNRRSPAFLQKVP